MFMIKGQKPLSENARTMAAGRMAAHRGVESDGAIAQQIMTESLLVPPVLLWKSLATELRTIGILQ